MAPFEVVHLGEAVAKVRKTAWERSYLCCHLHSLAGQAWDKVVRKGKLDAVEDHRGVLVGIPVDLAGIAILILEYTNWHGIDLAIAVSGQVPSHVHHDPAVAFGDLHGRIQVVYGATTEPPGLLDLLQFLTLMADRFGFDLGGVVERVLEREARLQASDPS